MSLKNFIYVFHLSFFILFFNACGGFDQNDKKEKENKEEIGVLIDSLVIGAKYINRKNISYTDVNGNFIYRGGKIEFFVGNIKIGEVNKLPKDKKVFIQDIVGVPRKDINDERVIKIGTFLQSIDSDKQTNNIEISKMNFEKFLDINKNILNINLTELFLQKGFVKVSEKKVIEHLDNTLKKYEIISDIDKPDVEKNLIFSTKSKISVNQNETKILTVKAINKNQTKYILDGIDKNNFNINEKTGLITFKNYLEKDLKESYSITIKTKNTAKIVYSLEGIDKDRFTIDSESGELEFKKDYSDKLKNKYLVKVIAKDTKGNESEQVLVINVNKNMNEIDNDSISDYANKDLTAPIITTPSNITVDENQKSVLTVNATDATTVSYSLLGVDKDSFTINTTTGEIKFKVAPDYESKNKYQIIAVAKDVAGNEAEQNITINIKDLDDTAPVFTSVGTIEVEENQLGVLRVNATDATTVSYSLLGVDKDSFTINTTTGEIKFKSYPIYEVKNKYLIDVKAIDSKGNEAIQSIIIDIKNVNELSLALLKTGQTVSYATFDDGSYQKGQDRFYSRNADIVTDNLTKLQWQDNFDVKSNRRIWDIAKTYCQDLRLGDYSDWRLPTKAELLSIINYSLNSPSVESTYFNNVIDQYYWTETPVYDNSTNIFRVYFGNGVLGYSNKGQLHYIRCVRAGQ